MSKIYIPSEKYPPGAGINYMVALFLMLAGTGFLYGFWRGDQPIYDVGTSILLYIFLFLLVGYSMGIITQILKIRAPKTVWRWFWYVAIFWCVFSFIGLYQASGSNQGIFSFIQDRFENGINISYPGRSGGELFFHPHGFELLLIWLLEATILPLLAAGGSASPGRSGYPYSEDSDQWHKRPIPLPIRLSLPTFRDVQKNMNNSNFNWVTEARPHKDDPKAGHQIRLIFPKSKGIIYAWFNWFWEMTADEVRILIDTFDPNRKSKATRELECWEKINLPQKGQDE